jgi:hypothetical protein
MAKIRAQLASSDQCLGDQDRAGARFRFERHAGRLGARIGQVAFFSAGALIVLTSQAFAEAQVYPVGGLGDAWMQNQPSSIGITNGYDPRGADLLSSGQSALQNPGKSALSGPRRDGGIDKERCAASCSEPAVAS